MSKTVWKFPLGLWNEESIIVPEGSVFRSVGMQRSKLCVWVEVSTDATLAKCSRTIYVCGTGHLIPEGDAIKFIGTAIDHDLNLVWHVYASDEEKVP